MLLSFAPFQANQVADQVETPQPPLPTDVEILPETGGQDDGGLGTIGLIAIIALVIAVFAILFSVISRRPPA